MRIVLKYHFAILCLFFVAGLNGQRAGTNKLTSKEKKEGWTLLFDGTTSTGWTKSNGQPFPEKGWKITNGTIMLDTTANGGDIVTVNEYGDFELSVDFLLTPGCNSGIKYLFYKYPKGGSLGMEYQVMDDAGAADNKLTNHTCGSLYDIFPPNEKIKKVAAMGQWNTARIINKGKHTEHWLNGIKVLEFDRDSPAYFAAVEKSKYKTEPVFGTIEKGKILLQDHDHEVSFRNIKIREL